MQKLFLAVVLFVGATAPAFASYASCTLLAGQVICMPTSDLHAESGSGPCYDAQVKLVEAQIYAARWAEVDATGAGRMMGAASDEFYRSCGWH